MHMNIDPGEWSFDEIRRSNPARADRLEACSGPSALVSTLVADLDKAVSTGNIHLAMDSLNNKFMDYRSIVQFPVCVDTYDWFFNARTGYRGQFYLGPKAGTLFNTQIIKAIREELSRKLPESLDVWLIEVVKTNDSREDHKLGRKSMRCGDFLDSLGPDIGKVWIGERLYSAESDMVEDIGLAVIIEAQKHLPKLNIPRWASAVQEKTGEQGEGLRAPYPAANYAWLDVKGGFISKGAEPRQIKIPEDRAQKIHETGWT